MELGKTTPLSRRINTCTIPLLLQCICDVCVMTCKVYLSDSVPYLTGNVNAQKGDSVSNKYVKIASITTDTIFFTYLSDTLPLQVLTMPLGYNTKYNPYTYVKDRWIIDPVT